MPHRLLLPQCQSTKLPNSNEQTCCDNVNATARGFEPLRAEPNGFRVHHLNHSVTLSCLRMTLIVAKKLSTYFSVSIIDIILCFQNKNPNQPCKLSFSMLLSQLALPLSLICLLQLQTCGRKAVNFQWEFYWVRIVGLKQPHTNP